MDINYKKFVVIGDSHSIIWGGNLCNETLVSRRYNPKSKIQNVEVFWLGPALAYNLMSKDQQLGKWGKKAFEIINFLKVKKIEIEYILLSFGEIDIRVHVIKQALMSNVSIEKIVDDLTTRFINFSKIFFTEFRIPLLLWEPISTVPQFYKMHPSIGSEKERNYATELFSNLLKKKSSFMRDKGLKIYSFGIFNKTTTNYDTHIDYKEDGLHLNLNGFQLAIKEIEILSKNEGLDCEKYFLKNIHNFKNFKELDITEEVKFKISSEYLLPSTLTHDFGRGFCFHTNKERNPTLYIDIGYALPLTRVLITNRKDGWQERAKSIEVLVGNTVNDFVKISNNEWENLSEPLEIKVNISELNLFRYIKIRLKDEDYLHLYSVRIFALKNAV